MESTKQTEYLTEKSESNNNVFLVVVVLAVVLAVVALIIAVVSISQNGSSDINVISAGPAGSTSTSGLSGGDDRIWQLAFEHTGGPYGYIDDASGEIRGFAVDLANTLCQIARKNCQIVYDSPQRCWDSQTGSRPQGGEGLLAGYYDACVGWIETYERPRTFKFTKSYSVDIVVVFLVKKGNTSFNWKDLTGSVIGFVDGWAYDEHCIAREEGRITGANLSPEQVRHYPGRDELFNGLIAGEIDAMFDYKQGWPAKDSQTEIVSEDITSCLKSGDSVMTRKDNGLVEWWNAAFDSLTPTSQWRTLCNSLREEHGHKPGPDPEDYCIGY